MASLIASLIAADPGIAWAQVLPLLLPLPLIVLANLSDRAAGRMAEDAYPAPPEAAASAVKRGTSGGDFIGFGGVDNATGMATWVVLAICAIALVLIGLISVSAGRIALAGVSRDEAGYGVAISLTGIAAALTLARPLRALAARAVPIDPDSAVHGAALFLSLTLLGTQLGAVLTLNVLGAATLTPGPLGPADLIAQEVPYLLAGLFGVGMLVRRGRARVQLRLGFVRPALWQVVLALAAAGVFYAVSAGAGALGDRLTPDLARQVRNSTEHLFGGLTTPLGIATIALAPGICEEALFRGALQPRLGLLFTSFLFAAVHTEYGLSFDTLAVLVLAVCLGLIRRYANTTTSTLCHVSYNALAGIGIGGILVLPAILVEVLLLGAAAGLWLVKDGVGSRAPAG